MLPAAHAAWRGDVVTAGGLFATGVLAPNAIARLLTNDKFMNWALKSGQPMLNNPNSISTHLGRLLAISANDSQLREDVEAYIQAWAQTFSHKAPEDSPEALVEFMRTLPDDRIQLPEITDPGGISP